MGLVINPTGYRIGYTKYWQDSWYLHRMNYPVFVHKSLEMKLLMEFALRKRRRKSFWVYSHATFYSFHNKFIVNIFLYDGVVADNYFRFSRKLKWRYYRKLKFINRFTKKQLLDRIYYYQRWWLLCQIFGFEMEHLMLDDLKWHIKPKHWRKLTSLRQRYGFQWVSREELLLRKNLILMNRYHNYVYLGMKRLNIVFKRYILRNLKFNLRLKGRKVLRRYNEKNFERANHVLQSYRKLFMFFSFFDKFARIIPTYPSGIFNKLSLKILFKFFRIYFVFRPYWIKVSKFYHLLFTYIGIDSKINIYFLDNQHLSAQFLAHYVMTSLRYRFSFNDTMIPIKKTLWKIMKCKTWEKPNTMKHYTWNVLIDRFSRLFNDRYIFYRDLYFFSLLNIVKRKVVKYLRSKKNRYIYKIIRRARHRIRFKMFNHSIFKRNLVRLKTKISTCKYLLKKKRLVFSRRPSFSKYSLFYTKKRLFKILKDNIMRRLSVVHKFDGMFIKIFSGHSLEYVFMNIRKATKIKKYSYLSKQSWKSNSNYQAKFKNIRRKLRKTAKFLRRLQFLVSRKNFLIKYLSLCLFFIARHLVLHASLNTIRLKLSILSKFFLSRTKARYIRKFYRWRKKIFVWNFKRDFYRKYHIKPKKHYRFSARFRPATMRMNYLRRRLRYRLKRRKPFLFLKKRRIKTRYLLSISKSKLLAASARYSSFFMFAYVSAFFVKSLFLFSQHKRVPLFFIRNKFFKFSTNKKFAYFSFMFKPLITKETKKEFKNIRGRRAREAFKEEFMSSKILAYGRGYFKTFADISIVNYSKKFLPFIFDLDFYGQYLQKLKRLPAMQHQIKRRQIKKKDLLFTPLINKFRRLKFLEGKKKSLLYGYKFHFSGRFTRKQKASSLWFSKGANPVSSMAHDVEYGFHTVTLKYSACTLKVWLYKNRAGSPKHGYRLV